MPQETTPAPIDPIAESMRRAQVRTADMNYQRTTNATIAALEKRIAALEELVAKKRGGAKSDTTS
jgi:O-acetylhomoserine/O-acetylserine sulfhydrylase-like pyridoxal-dependent enzyme